MLPGVCPAAVASSPEPRSIGARKPPSCRFPLPPRFNQPSRYQVISVVQLDLVKRIKSLFFKPSYEDTITSFTKELDNGQKRLFHEYEQKREGLNFTTATMALQSLLTQDTDEKHREFYLSLIEEMKIYLSHPEIAVEKSGPSEREMDDEPPSKPDIQFNDGVMRYTFRGKGKIGYRRKEEK
jgi:hypothetical protein